MNNFILTRYGSTPLGTFGELQFGAYKCFTVERPWLDNKPSISCIPAGEYILKPRRYNRGGYDAIEIRDVPDRTHILIHKANRWHEVEGCIAPGVDLGVIGAEWGVVNSKDAFEMIMRLFRASASWQPEVYLSIMWQNHE